MPEQGRAPDGYLVSKLREIIATPGSVFRAMRETPVKVTGVGAPIFHPPVISSKEYGAEIGDPNVEVPGVKVSEVNQSNAVAGDEKKHENVPPLIVTPEVDEASPAATGICIRALKKLLNETSTTPTASPQPPSISIDGNEAKRSDLNQDAARARLEAVKKMFKDGAATQAMNTSELPAKSAEEVEARRYAAGVYLAARQERLDAKAERKTTASKGSTAFYELAGPISGQAKVPVAPQKMEKVKAEKHVNFADPPIFNSRVSNENDLRMKIKAAQEGFKEVQDVASQWNDTASGAVNQWKAKEGGLRRQIQAVHDQVRAIENLTLTRLSSLAAPETAMKEIQTQVKNIEDEMKDAEAVKDKSVDSAAKTAIKWRAKQENLRKQINEVEDGIKAVELTHETIDVDELDRVHRGAFKFMENAIRTQTASETQLQRFLKLLDRPETFRKCSTVIPELRWYQGHDVHESNALITRILEHTRHVRPLPPLPKGRPPPIVSINNIPLDDIPFPFDSPPMVGETIQPLKEGWRVTQVEDMCIPVKYPFQDIRMLADLRDAVEETLTTSASNSGVAKQLADERIGKAFFHIIHGRLNPVLGPRVV